MNTKGMKFLAVLAVLAMAFAAVAVIAPAETDDALPEPQTTETLTLVASNNATLSAGLGYFVNANVSVVLPEVLDTTNPVKLYVLDGKSVTISTPADAYCYVEVWCAKNVSATTELGVTTYTVTVDDAVNADAKYEAYDESFSIKSEKVGNNGLITLISDTNAFNVAGEVSVSGTINSIIMHYKQSMIYATNVTGIIATVDDATEIRLVNFTGVIQAGNYEAESIEAAEGLAICGMSKGTANVTKGSVDLAGTIAVNCEITAVNSTLTSTEVVNNGSISIFEDEGASVINMAGLTGNGTMEIGAGVELTGYPLDLEFEDVADEQAIDSIIYNGSTKTYTVKADFTQLAAAISEKLFSLTFTKNGTWTYYKYGATGIGTEYVGEAVFPFDGVNTSFDLYTSSDGTTYTKTYTVKIEVDEATVTTSEAWNNLVAAGNNEISSDIALGTNVTIDKNITVLKGATITVADGKTITVSENYRLTVSGSIVKDTTGIISNNGTIYITKDGSLNIDVTCNEGTSSAAAASFTNVVAGTGGLTVSAGSVEMYGSMASGTFTLTAGELVIPRNLTLGSGVTNVDDGANVFTTTTASLKITINKTATVTVTKEATFGTYDAENPSDITNNGTILLAGTLKGSVANKGTISITDKDAVFDSATLAVTEGQDMVITDSIRTEKTENGEIFEEKTSHVGQFITLTGDTTLISPTELHPNVTWTLNTATLYIPAGTTFTIENGAKLKLNSYSHVINFGTIVFKNNDLDDPIVDNAALSFIENYGTISITAVSDSNGDNSIAVETSSMIVNSGEIIVSGAAAVSPNTAANVTFTANNFENKAGAILSVGSYSTFVSSGLENAGTVNVTGTIQGTVTKNSGVLNVTGTLKANVDSNKGSVVIDGYLGSLVTITNASTIKGSDKNATAQASVIINKIQVKDIATVGYTLTVKNSGEDNKVTISFASCIDGTSATDSGYAQTYKLVDLAIVSKWTKATSATDVVTTTKALDLSGDAKVVYTGSKTYKNLDDTVLFKLEGADVTVDSVLTTDEGIKVENFGTLTVSGTMKYNNDATAFFQAPDCKVIASGMLETYALPAGGQIDGAMYITTQKVDNVDVNTYHYTTLVRAIENGADKITVNGDQTIESDLTVPADVKVTFYDTIIVKKGVVMVIADGASVVPAGANTADPAVIVYGTLDVKNKNTGLGTAADRVDSDVLKVVGNEAIYTNIKKALDDAVAGETVTLNKIEVESTEDLTVKTGVVLEIDLGQNLTVKGAKLTDNGMISMANQTCLSVINVDEDKKGSFVLAGLVESDELLQYNGASDDAAKKIAGAYFYDGSKYYISLIPYAMGIIDDITDISFEGKNTLTADLTVSPAEATPISVNGDLTVTKFTMSKMTLTFANNIVLNGTFADASGAIKLTNAKVAEDLTSNTIAADATDGLIVSLKAGNVSDEKKLAVETSGIVEIDKAITPLTVKSGITTLKANIETLAVDAGAMAVAGANIEVANATVLGDLSGVNTDAATYTITTNKLYVGGKSSDILKNVAAATGVIGHKVVLSETGVAYVLPGCSVDDDLAKQTGVKHVTYTLEDKKILDAYVMNGQKVGEPKTSVVDGVVSGWYYDSTHAYDFNTEVTKDYDLVAKIKSEIYDVTLRADSGIGTIYFNGKIVTKDNDGTYHLYDLAKGKYEIKYVIAAGYNEFTAELSIGSDTGDKAKYVTVSGLEFTLGGSSADNTAIKLDLYGSTAIDDTPIPEPEPLAPETWNITTILLLILVILIAIMAVIVAIRLNRS